MIKKALKIPLMAAAVGLCRPIAKRHRGLGVCLMYHEVLAKVKTDGFCPNKRLFVETKQFEDQMAWISSHYRPVSLGTMVSGLMRGDLSPGSVAITFDDGYAGNLRCALPVLEKYNVPATIYAAVGFIDGSHVPWWFELEDILNASSTVAFCLGSENIERDVSGFEQKQEVFSTLSSYMMSADPLSQNALMVSLRKSGGEKSAPYGGPAIMSWNELKALASHPLITIGSHGCGHYVYSSLTGEVLENDMRSSKKRLEKELGKPVEHLSYPFGTLQQASGREAEAAVKAGYLSAVTTRAGNIMAGHKGQLAALPRLPVDVNDSVISVRWKIEGFESLRKNGRSCVAD